MELSRFDDKCMQKAIMLALEARNEQNLPIGAVISLDRKLIAEGKNTIWRPSRSLHRHAEMEALANIPEGFKLSTKAMTIYTTLEPCLMCLGAILLYGIGRVIYGAVDPFGGAVNNPGNLPAFFREKFSTTAWIGPAYPEECNPLYKQIVDLENLPGQI